MAERPLAVPAPRPMRMGTRVAVAALAVIVLAAVAAPLIAPYDPFAQPDIVGGNILPPTPEHPLGTDQFSRDVLSRVLFGARVSLLVGLLATTVAVTVGTAWGLAAGYVGGVVDEIMMRLVDALMSIPRVLLVLALVALWGRMSTTGLVLLLGLTGWFQLSRLVRAEVLTARETDYVASARALGAHDFRIAVRHVLPNVLPPIIVFATIGLGNVIVLEAGLSYLGFGIQPPIPSWGNMIRDGSELMTAAWWISLFPGLAIVATVVAVNALGDGLRQALGHTDSYAHE
ncbi:MAG: ABC transporter permease [Gemmatimonadaceae bacterium]